MKLYNTFNFYHTANDTCVIFSMIDVYLQYFMTTQWS